jgi:hypothetical protein
LFSDRFQYRAVRRRQERRSEPVIEAFNEASGEMRLMANSNRAAAAGCFSSAADAEDALRSGLRAAATRNTVRDRFAAPPQGCF